MKKSAYLAIFTLFISIATTVKSADSVQPPASEAQNVPLRVESEQATMTGTVQQVHRVTRFLTVKTPDGAVDLKVTLEADGLEKIKPGDQVSVSYLKPVALALHKTDEAAAAAKPSGVVQLSPKGQPPVMTLVDAFELTGTVEKIDPLTRTITVRGAQHAVSLSVPEGNPILTRLKQGDKVSARYSESLALGVNKT